MNEHDGRVRIYRPPGTSEFEIQPSQLIQSLFENLPAEQRLVVLNLGAALPETISFLAKYRCKLYVTDLLTEFPLAADSPSDEEESPGQRRKALADILSIPEGVVFDIVFF